MDDVTLIALKNISRTFVNGEQQVTVLHDITLTIEAGESVAIIGPSGSGKSTLMNLLGCLDVADKGEYRLRGQLTGQMSPDQLAAIRRRHLGFIFQRYQLMSELTALENVEIPAVYASTCRDERRREASALLTRLGLAEQQRRKPAQLSGGQQQRVCIARALINGAEIILADEPTGALDSHTGQEVMSILSELHQRGHTLILVTHDMNVARYADRIIEIQDGRIVADSGRKARSTLAATPAPLQPRAAWHSLSDRLREALRMAFHAMLAHRLRTALTMTGIIFGIAAVVIVVALGQGAKQSTLERLQDLASNVVSVYAGDFSMEQRHPVMTLTLADAKALAQQPFVDSVSPIVSSSQPLRYLAKSANAYLLGVNRDYFRIQGLKLVEGTLFSSHGQQVILDQTARQTLFASGPAIGKVIMVGDLPATVTGVVRNDSNPMPNQLNAFMPDSSVMQRLLGVSWLSGINVRLKEESDSQAAMVSINQLLTLRHGSKDFMLFNQDKLRKSIEKTASTLNLLILLVASISLLIGSIGVMNIMLISVTERTHEIGVRMAVGARRSDIMQQFMIEAVLICLLGGGLGIALSLGLSPLLASTGSQDVRVIYSWQAAAAAFFCSTLIGMVFGWLPARKAAHMDPVTALASE